MRLTKQFRAKAKWAVAIGLIFLFMVEYEGPHRTAASWVAMFGFVLAVGAYKRAAGTYQEVWSVAEQRMEDWAAFGFFWAVIGFLAWMRPRPEEGYWGLLVPVLAIPMVILALWKREKARDAAGTHEGRRPAGEPRMGIWGAFGVLWAAMALCAWVSPPEDGYWGLLVPALGVPLLILVLRKREMARRAGTASGQEEDPLPG